MISVLYVDDESILCEITKLYLERFGDIRVTTLNRADDALVLLKTTSYDAIVSDYQMPEMDGIEFLKSLRAQEKNLPFILFTGKGREEVVIQALNEGADFYLQKGGDPKSQFTELAHKIRQSVERRNIEQSLSTSQKRLSDIIDFLPDATFAIDNECRVIAWNKAIEDMTSVRKEEIIGKNNYEYSLAFYKERRPVLIDLVLNFDSDIEKRYPFIRKEHGKLVSEVFIPHFNEGKGMHLWFTASPLLDNSGSIVGAIESVRDISEQKRAESALEKRVLALTMPQSNIQSLKFSDLYNISDLQRIQDSFSEATGVASIITDTEGVPITKPSNFCKLCKDIIRNTEKGRINCFKSDSVIGSYNSQGPVISQCLSGGLWDAGASITVAGKHLANWLIGQVRNDELDENKILGYAKEIGADPEEFRHALEEVPVMPKKQFETIAKALFLLANELSLKSYQNIEQARFINEIKKTQQALSKSEQQYHDLLMQLPDIVLIHRDGIVVFANEVAVNFFGYSRGELIGTDISLYIHPDDLTFVRDNMERRVKGEFVSGYEIRVMDNLHEFHNVIVKANSTQFEGETGVLTILADITSLRETEQNLIESEEKWRNLAENCPFGILIFQDEDWVYANPASEQISGYKREEIYKMPFYELVTPDYQQYLRDKGNRRQTENTPPLTYEFKIRTKNGEERWVTLTACTIEYGKNVAGLITVVDINELKVAESSYKNAIEKNIVEYEELSKTFEKFFKVFTTTSILMAISTVDEGRFIDVNNAFLAILGYSKDEVIGHTSQELHIFDDPLFRMSKKDEVLQKSGIHDLEIKVRAKDGEIHTGIGSCHPITIQEKTYFLSVMNDITERIKIEEALHITNQKLNLLNSITLHDINNQIVILSGFASLLEESEISPMVREYSGKILLAAERIISMIQFSREYHLIGISSPEWLNVKEIVNLAFSLVSPGYVSLENNIRPDVEIFSDPLISKVFFNIIENSERHGGSITKITCSSFETEKGITVIIEDDGTGISPEKKEKIFEREYGKNTGLGLFITREILGITGITIIENGIFGTGAKFEIHVPKESYRLITPENPLEK